VHPPRGAVERVAADRGLPLQREAPARSPGLTQLGACAKDFHIYFWDHRDGFGYASSLPVFAAAKENQTRLWYVDFLDAWVSTDSKCVLFFWDLREHRDVGRIHVAKREREEAVVDLKPLEHLRLLVVATDKKNLSVWNYERMENLINLHLQHGGVHSLQVFATYQVVLVAGYENTIPVFSITPDFYDLNTEGRLVGHVSLVSAITVIEKTPMAISCDDKGVMKIWDIRTFLCVQSINLGGKFTTNFLIHMASLNRIAFVGSRINYMEFDTKLREKGAEQLKTQLIGSGFNESTAEFFIATNSEVRVVDAHSGRTKRVFVNLLKGEQQDEATLFKLVPKKGCFVLGDDKGAVNVYHLATGALLRASQPHSAAVSGLKFDADNDILLSTSADCTMKAQVEQRARRKKTKTGGQNEVDPALAVLQLPKDKPVEKLTAKKFKKEVMRDLARINEEIREGEDSDEETEANDLTKQLTVVREIAECNFEQDIALMDLSVFHNLVALASGNNRVYIYNYEFMKPCFEIEIVAAGEVTMLLFLNGYGKLLVGMSSGRVFMFTVKFNDSNYLVGRYDGFFSVAGVEYADGNGGKAESSGSANKGVADFAFKTREAKLAKATSVNLDNATKRAETGLDLSLADVYLSDSHGVVSKFDFFEYLSSQEQFHMAANNQTFNPHRQASENFTTSIQLIKERKLTVDAKTSALNLQAACHRKSFRVARDALTSLELVKLSQKYLAVCSLDNTFRVFTVSGEQCCHFNLTHPLPIKWDFWSESSKLNKGRLLFALKVVEVMNQRKPKETRKEAPMLTIQDIVNQFQESHFSTFKMTGVGIVQPVSKMRNQTSLDDVSKSPTNNPVAKEQPSVHFEGQEKSILMKDVYIPKDLAYEKIKRSFREEIMGPTLKEMDVRRRAKNIGAVEDPLHDFAVSENIIEKSKFEESKRNKDPGFFHKLAVRPEFDLTELDERGGHELTTAKLKSEFSRIDTHGHESEADADRMNSKQARVQEPESSILSSMPSRVRNLRDRFKDSMKVSEVEPLSKLNFLRGGTTDGSKFFKEKQIEDFFEYATKRNLKQKEESSFPVKMRTEDTNDESQSLRLFPKVQTRAKSRKIEKHSFHSILKEMDRRIMGSKKGRTEGVLECAESGYSNSRLILQKFTEPSEKQSQHNLAKGEERSKISSYSLPRIRRLG
jgi:WD40 repeat protein